MIPTLTLALNPAVTTGLVVVFLLVCVAMILLILIQRPQGGGLSGAFGAGGGAGQTAFGTKTGDVLTLVTIGIFVLFLILAVVLNFAARPASAPSPEAAASGLGDPEAEVIDQAVEDAAQDAEALINDAAEQTDTEPPAVPEQDAPATPALPDESQPSDGTP